MTRAVRYLLRQCKQQVVFVDGAPPSAQAERSDLLCLYQPIGAQENGFVAVKVTALCPSTFLKKASALLVQYEQFWSFLTRHKKVWFSLISGSCNLFKRMSSMTRSLL